jgi:UrcA family protein
MNGDAIGRPDRPASGDFPMPRTIAPTAAALAAALAAIASQASARTFAEPAAVSVPYGDLDLDSPAGVRSMLRRLEEAAGRACGRQPTGLRLGEAVRVRNCRADVMRQAVVQLDRPMLTASLARRDPSPIRVAHQGAD